MIDIQRAVSVFWHSSLSMRQLPYGCTRLALSFNVSLIATCSQTARCMLGRRPAHPLPFARHCFDGVIPNGLAIVHAQAEGKAASKVPEELVTADEEDGGVMRSHSSFTFDTPPPSVTPPPTIEEVGRLAVGWGEAFVTVRLSHKEAVRKLRVFSHVKQESGTPCVESHRQMVRWCLDNHRSVMLMLVDSPWLMWTLRQRLRCSPVLAAEACKVHAGMASDSPSMPVTLCTAVARLDTSPSSIAPAWASLLVLRSSRQTSAHSLCSPRRLPRCWVPQRSPALLLRSAATPWSLLTPTPATCITHPPRRRDRRAARPWRRPWAEGTMMWTPPARATCCWAATARRAPGRT